METDTALTIVSLLSFAVLLVGWLMAPLNVSSPAPTHAPEPTQSAA